MFTLKSLTVYFLAKLLDFFERFAKDRHITDFGLALIRIKLLVNCFGENFHRGVSPIRLKGTLT